MTGLMVGLAVGVGDDMGTPTDPPVPDGRGPTVWVMGQMRMSNRAAITAAPGRRLREDDSVFCMSVSIARTAPNGERESVEKFWFICGLLSICLDTYSLLML